MASTALLTEDLYEASLRQGQVKHALKTALACCLATLLAYYYHVPSRQFAPLFAFLIMTLGMPSPRLNWLFTLFAILVSAFVSACILMRCHDALYLFLAVTLLWIFTVLLFSTWFPLPATLGAMVSALGVFVIYNGTVGETLWFYFGYGINWFIAGVAVVLVDTLIWPFTTRKVFVDRLAEVYAHLEGECRQAARRIRSGETQSESETEWAPFRRLHQMLAPELRVARDTSNPFARMILACRSLNLRLRFFNRTVAPATLTLPSDTRQQLASLLDRCAEQLHTLLEGALHSKPVSPIDAGILRAVSPVDRVASGGDYLLRHGIHTVVLYRLVEDLQTATAAHCALFDSFRKGLAGEMVAVAPAAKGRRLFETQSVRSATKLVLILVLLLVEEGLLGFPGGSQVAFYATFFASTGNLGRQNKTNLVGVAGLLCGFAYGVAAAFLTSRMPHFPLLLSLVFLGQFLAMLAYQKLPRYGAAGLQAGLALPFAYLATTGPDWGSFDTVRTRWAGLVVAGFTAVVVHAYLWPILPMRQLRASIAAALRATAVSLAQLFGPQRLAWAGPPSSLSDTVTRARDLLDDARYLPGPDHADSDYHGILAGLQELDANLEFLHFLLGLEEENLLRQRFFQVIGDYPAQAQSNLEQVARQFQKGRGGAADGEPIRWEPDVTGRWERALRDFGPIPVHIDPARPVVLARCLEQIARAVEQISAIASEINRRNRGSA